MSERSTEIQYLLDRAAIQDLLLRYFHGLDRCDPVQVRTCFTDDVQAHYDHRPPAKGIEEIMRGFRTFKRIPESKLKMTTHFMGNLNIRQLEGDLAETETRVDAQSALPRQAAPPGKRLAHQRSHTHAGLELSGARELRDHTRSAHFRFAAALVGSSSR
jgi:hypothetical protein